MFENRFHRKLNLPFEFKPNTYNVDTSRYNEISITDIDTNLIEWLESLGCFVIHARYFYMPAAYSYPLHIDVNRETNDYARLNFVYGGVDSDMIWYKLKAGKSSIEFPNNLGELVSTYRIVDCDELYRVRNLNGPNLVNVGTIHTVRNYNTARHCHAFFVSRKGLNKRLSWDDFLNLCSSMDRTILS